LVQGDDPRLSGDEVVQGHGSQHDRRGPSADRNGETAAVIDEPSI
jgi:hypothetical protein